MSTDTYYGIDPIFNDDTDYINCDTCKRLFNHNEYDSFTCSACESGEYEEKESEPLCGDHLTTIRECGCRI